MCLNFGLIFLFSWICLSFSLKLSDFVWIALSDFSDFVWMLTDFDVSEFV